MGEMDQQGKLYLGREYEMERETISTRPFLYDMRHLTTHAVILGMTGSGKTGAGLVLLEELLLQGVPVLALDPKGDIANLLLTFPDLRAEDFAPWLDATEARQRGVSPAEYAAEVAHRWREGLAEWEITGARIARLRENVQMTLFTPGSEVGQPVDVLHFFNTPDLDWDEHEEALRERIGGIVSALLGLVGLEADPLQSPAHILLARLIEQAWRNGETIDLPTLIRLLQKPPFRQVGIFEMETFFPEKDRFALARTLNNLIAAPGFEVWQKGAALDVASLLYAADGRPRANIFYLAHLDDAQRMFFVTLFLEAVRDWLRAQSGTTNLRVALYFDELFGYFPPYPARPPSKTPLLALVKQGRAAGLGLVLATQNPADLDYKGLTNAGTWIIGSLRAERDKQRILEGLEGALSEAGEATDRAALDRALGALKPRVFLAHDIHAGPPFFFHTRWAMSYLSGPLTRKQIKHLLRRQGEEDIQRGDEKPGGGEGRLDAPPALPPDIPQVFLPPTVTFEWALRGYEEQAGRQVWARERRLLYTPHLLAIGVVRIVDARRGIDHVQSVARLVRLAPDGPARVDWNAGSVTVRREELAPRPIGEATYAPIPASLARSADLKRLEKEFADYLYYNTSLILLRNPALGLDSRPGEERREFRIRCEEAARRGRDDELKKAHARLEQQIARVEERLRREERELSMDQKELEARKREELLSLGESAFNLLARRRPSYIVSRASTKRRLTQQAEAEVEESVETIEDLQKQLADLKAQAEAQAAEIGDRWAAKPSAIEEIELKPRRMDVAVEFCGLAWTPVWQVTCDDGQQVTLPARET